MERQPNPDDPAYRDQSTKKKLDSKKTKTPGQRLEDSGQYLKDPETEDLSKGSLMIKGAEMSPEMKETYTNNPGYPKFNEGTKKVMQGTKRGSKERLQGLKENIGNYGKIAGRTALAIKPDLKTTIGLGAGILSLLINNPTRRLGGAF